MITLQLLRVCHVWILLIFVVIWFINRDVVFAAQRSAFKPSYFLSDTQTNDDVFRPIIVRRGNDVKSWKSVDQKSLEVPKFDQSFLDSVRQKLKYNNSTKDMKENDGNFSMEKLIKSLAKSFFAYVKLDTNQTSKSVNNTEAQTEEELKANWFVKVFNCIRSRNILQCLRIFFLQRTTSALEAKERMTSLKDVLFSSSDNKTSVDFEKFENLTSDEIDQKIMNTLFLLFENRPFKFGFTPNLEFQIIQENNTLSLATKVTQTESRNDVKSRGVKSMIEDMMPWPFVPSIFWATVLPMMIPGIKMAVMFAMMINQAAFMMALMALLRGLIFGRRNDNNVVYANYGYDKEPWQYGQNSYNHKVWPPKILVHEKWIDD